MTTTKSYRYDFPQKAIKIDCPACQHKKTYSLYVDTRTGETLPESYGRCDRESNCGHHLSPYHKGPSGLSYADEVRALEGTGPLPKTWFVLAGELKRKGIGRSEVTTKLMLTEGATSEQAERVANYIFDKTDTPTAAPKVEKSVYSIPVEVLQQSLGHYERNQFAILLVRHLGQEVAFKLLNLFQVGTSSRWPGACVFWYIDQQNRVRGGQIKLFDESFHTVKYVDQEGNKRSKTSWVHSAYARRCDEHKQPYPAWLSAYMDPKNAVDKSPCLFGLPQLKNAPIDHPVAIVESPKTAIICTHYFKDSDFVWLAVGGKSYLNADRLAPLRGRKICLFPDLNAYHDLVNEKGQINKGWLTKAKELQALGFDIMVSDYLESQATDEHRAKGLDLADFLLESQIHTEDQPQEIDIISSEERIEATVINEWQTDINPTQSTQRPHKIPALIQHYWTLFEQPPLVWNRWLTLRYIREWVEKPGPESEFINEPVIVTSIAEQASRPGSILRPDESQLERLDVDPADSYPTEWDEPIPPDAVPTIRVSTPTSGSYFGWQNNPESPFSQLGLASLENKPHS